MLTVTQAAIILRLSTARVRALCAMGRIPAVKLGRDWLIREPRVTPVTRGRPVKGVK